MAATKRHISSCAMEILCGYCSISLRHVPEDHRIKSDTYFRPNGSIVTYISAKRYCSEYCLIQDYCSIIGPPHFAACVARIVAVKPSFDLENYSKINLFRGARMHQVLPAPPMQSDRPSYAKVARMPVDSMTD